MGQIILPDRYRGDFRWRGRKSAGQVKINWSNSLTVGLKICYVPVSTIPINLAARKPLGGNSPPPFGYSRGKRCLVYSTNGSRVFNPVKTDVYLNQGEHTFLCEWRSDIVSTGVDPFILSDTHSSNTGIVLHTYGFAGSAPDQTAALRITYGGVAAYTPSSDFEVNKGWQSIGFSGTVNSDYDYVLNGKFIDNTSVGTIKVSPEPLWLYGYGRSSIGMVGAVGYSYYWDRRLSEAECKAIADNPYQILKLRTPRAYSIPSGAPATGQEALISFGINSNATFAAVSIKGAGITQAVNLDTQIAGDAASNAAVSAGLQAGYSAGSENSIEADLSFALQPAMSVTANAAASSDILAAIQAGVLFAAIAQTEATITLVSTVGSSMTAQVSAGGDVEASIGVDVVAGAQLSAEAQASADLTVTSNVGAQVDAQSDVEANITGGSVVDAQTTADVSHEATVSFALQLSTTKTAEAIANASITLDASLATMILAQAAAEAGIAVGQVVNVVFDATTIAGDIITPDGRTYRVSAESRIFVVPYENRTFTIH